MAEKDDRTIGGIRGIKASRLERGSIRLLKIHTIGPLQEHISNSGPFISIYLRL